MWFLTQDGIDRYNGKEFKTYRLTDGDREIYPDADSGGFYTDRQGGLWKIEPCGTAFRYDHLRDRFTPAYRVPLHADDDGREGISCSYMDGDDIIWFCSRKYVYAYDIGSGRTSATPNRLPARIICMEQIGDGRYVMGTEEGMHYVELSREGMSVHACGKLDSLHCQVNELFYHRESHKIFIGTFQRGLFVYDLERHELLPISSDLTDIHINRICSFGRDEVLVATGGAGVYKVHTGTYACEPYLTADYTQENGLNGNHINDLYIDPEQRIWMANYPIGITVCDPRYRPYRWIRHSTGNPQSLVHNQVNAIMEDSDGDLWFATNNGVSLFDEHRQRWHSFLSLSDTGHHSHSHTFISLCEVRPGVVWTGGYGSGVYEIDKRTLSVSSFTPSSYNADIRPDKYIRSIIKDREGIIWSGGYYNLKRTDLKQQSVRQIPGIKDVTAISEHNGRQLWIGCADGLYLLDKESTTCTAIALPAKSAYICSLYQAPDSTLYIGTKGAGLLVYRPAEKTFTHFHRDNSALISNNIYTILSDGGKEILLSTEYGLSLYHTDSHLFRNWTKEQGLLSDHFNSDSGIRRRNGHYVLGSTEGAVEVVPGMIPDRPFHSRMTFSDLRIFYQTVYPQEEGSPLTTDIDETEVLHLKYNQNIFSLQVSSINFDHPSMVLYSWCLEGFYDGWSRPVQESTIRFTNLSPGRYHLRVRAISSEDRRIVLEERSLRIIVDRPFWLSHWAIALYLLGCCTLAGIILRLLMLRRQRLLSNEKIHFFINTAHDIRTPLTLIKAPLEELSVQEPLSEAGRRGVETALLGISSLLRLTTNLINFERSSSETRRLSVEQVEISNYMEECVEPFRTYAASRQIDFRMDNQLHYLNVWMDREKMDSILKNLLSNALKYTPEQGKVTVTLSATDTHWCIEIKDSGIGIPASEQRRLFRIYFRGSNAVNAQISGSGIGLMLVRRLVRIHRGKMSFHSVEGEGTTVTLSFPKGEKRYRKYIRQHARTAPTALADVPMSTLGRSAGVPSLRETVASGSRRPWKLLIVEDNEELRHYLLDAFGHTYHVQACQNGKQALTIIGEYHPDLIISDIMMPEMSGDELCKLVKSNPDTSHIPIILLTALASEEYIIEGLQIGADDYIVKPFSMAVLKASAESLLNNRSLLRGHYADAGHQAPGEEEETEETDYNHCNNVLDWQFLAETKQYIIAHMHQPDFTVDVLCAQIGMSRTSFYHRIKTLTGQAPADYIRFIRLNQATRLLKEGKHNINEIADLTGFGDAKYFREVFKKTFGLSPTQYAKNMHHPSNEQRV